MIIAGNMLRCDLCGKEEFVTPTVNNGWNNLVLEPFKGPVMEKTDKPPLILCYRCSDSVRRKLSDLKWGKGE